MPKLESKYIRNILIGGYASVAGVFLFLMASVEVAQIMQSTVIAAYGDQPWVAYGYVFLYQVTGIVIAIIVSAIIAKDSMVRGYVWKASAFAYVINWGAWIAMSYVIVYYAPGSPMAGLDAWQSIVQFPAVMAYMVSISFPQGVPYATVAFMLTYEVLFTVFLLVLKPERNYMRVVDLKPKRRRQR